MSAAGTIVTTDPEPNLVCPKVDHDAIKFLYAIAPDVALSGELRLDSIDARGNVWLTCMKYGCKSCVFIEGPQRLGLGVVL